jgi:rare lipoprotein A
VRKPEPIRLLALLLAALVIGSCGSNPPSDGPPAKRSPSSLPPDAVPRQEPKSRYGNPPVYEVYGVRYKVMDSSYGYQQRGVASWYGKKFHGRATSSQEPYDMYAMTAAHKTLPLPTYVKVRNLKNNRSIIVRVNDRGPFVDNRIIDLSYAAAIKLDMVTNGTSLVEVTAISYDEPPAQAAAPPRAAPSATSNNDEHLVYVQVGAFGDIDNARRRYQMLRQSGIQNAVVHKDDSRKPTLYRIRIGPVNGADDYDRVVAELQKLGVTESHLVTN